VRLAVLALAFALPLGACGSDGDDEPAPVVASPLRVDLIDDAVSALEEQLGAPQEYYEINATAALVNLFVAGDGGVTAWVYLDGELSSEELTGTPEGATFRADAVAFDPDTVLDTVGTELPTTRQDAFEILGGPDGVVKYSVIATSAAGGQLIIQVGPEGNIIEVTTA
jgi:hypothetical protein